MRGEEATKRAWRPREPLPNIVQGARGPNGRLPEAAIAQLENLYTTPKHLVMTLASIIRSTVAAICVLWRHIRIFKCNRGLTFLNFMEAADVLQTQEGPRLHLKMRMFKTVGACH